MAPCARQGRCKVNSTRHGGASGFANRAEKDGKTYILILSEQEFEQFREYLKNGSADESVEFSGSEPADSDAGTEPGSYRIEIIEE